MGRMMETTPGTIADLILRPLLAAGGVLLARNADDRGAHGFVTVEMPDGEQVTIRIEMN